MGPPIFIGGNSHPIRNHAHTATSFNGATDFHRWKCLCAGAVRCLPKHASMGPPIFIGGNLAGADRRLCGFARFNGATDFHRWKLRACRLPSPVKSGFNGATDFHRWKFQGLIKEGAKPDPLQWGHRFSSVEMLPARSSSSRWAHASMGPPIFIGGNQREAQWRCRVVNSLQWGHRFSSVEIRSREAMTVTTPIRFNGATDFHRWKCQSRPA